MKRAVKNGENVFLIEIPEWKGSTVESNSKTHIKLKHERERGRKRKKK